MPFHRTWTPICLVIGEVFRCEILETRARLLGWKLVAPFNRFRLLPSQNLLRDRLGDCANTPRVPLAPVLEIVVPTFHTLIEAYNVFLLQWMDGQEPSSAGSVNAAALRAPHVCTRIDTPCVISVEYGPVPCFAIAFNTQQFPLLAVKFYTTLSAAHSNSPWPVYDRLSRRLFQTEQLTTLVD